MDVVLAMQISLKGEFGKGVAGAIELFHSGLGACLSLAARTNFAFIDR